MGLKEKGYQGFAGELFFRYTGASDAMPSGLVVYFARQGLATLAR
jgi:hypothetical protein